MTIVYRNSLNRPLTWDEVDNNFRSVDEMTSSVSNTLQEVQQYANQASQSAADAKQSAESVDDAVNAVYDEFAAPGGAAKVGVSTGETVQDVIISNNINWTSGATVHSPHQLVIYNGSVYSYTGTLPHSITETSPSQNSNWLLIVNGNQPTVSLTQFGAKGDGLTNDTVAIQNALDFAFNNNKKVVQSSGVFFLDGGNYLTIRSDCDFTGAVFKPSANWTGQIVVTQNDAPVTYDSTSSVVTNINATSALNRAAGSAYFDGLVSDTTLNGCYVQMTSPQQMYTFRDAIQTRLELNRFYNRGNAEVPLRYQLPNTITSIKALKIKNNVTTVTGLCVDESLTTRYRIIYIYQISRCILRNTSFFNRPITQNFSDSRIDIEGCYDLTVDGLFAPSVADSFDGTGDIYSYTIGLATSMNVKIKNASAGGEGWGANGSNDCCNIIFEDCDLNRIDFHKPFQQKLTVNRCKIGRWGILVTGMGDLVVHDPVFVAGQDGSSSYIATRADAGGWFDGDLYITNPVFTGRNSGAITSLINATSTVNQGPVAGSPITSTLFNKIVIKDHKNREGNTTNAFNTLISSNRDGYLLFPRVIDIDGMSFANLAKSTGIGLNIDFSNFKALFSDMTNAESSVTGRYTTDIYLRNIQTPYFSVSGNAATSGSLRQNPRIIVENMRHVIQGETSTLFETNQRGYYEFNESRLERLKLTYGNVTNGPAFVKMNGGSLIQPVTATTPIVAGDDNNTIVLDNVTIGAQFAAQSAFAISINLGRYSLLKRCEFFDVTAGKIYGVPLAAPNATTFTYTGQLRVGQEIYVANGYTSDSTYSVSRIRVPQNSGTVRTSVAGATNTLTAVFTVSNGVATSVAFTAPNNIIEVGL